MLRVNLTENTVFHVCCEAMIFSIFKDHLKNPVMKKILLAALIITGSSFTVQAQKFTQPNPVHAQEHPRDVKLFKEKSGLLTTSLNANDGNAAQTHLKDIMMLMNYR